MAADIVLGSVRKRLQPIQIPVERYHGFCESLCRVFDYKRLSDTS